MTSLLAWLLRIVSGAARVDLVDDRDGPMVTASYGKRWPTRI